MSYEYTDRDGAELTVNDSPREDGVYLGIFEGGPVNGVIIPRSEAPALALSILAAAQVKPELEGRDSDAQAAAYWLHKWADRRAEQAAREAEDAKVRAFRAHQWKAQDENRNNVMPAWDDIDNYGRNLWRTEYRAARAFFQQEHENAWRTQPTPTGPAVTVTDEEAADIRTHLDGNCPGCDDEKAPAPRVLQYGDPEPDRDTKWKDRHGDIWRYADGGWKWKGEARSWEDHQNYWPEIFPMTEVTR